LFSTVELGGDQIAVDYLRGSARCSPYTSKFKRAIAIPRKPYQTQWFDVPHIKVSRDIRAIDLLARFPGEAIGGKLTAQERLAQWQVADYLDLDAQIARTEEKQCADVLTTGKLEIKDGDDDQLLQTLDFGPPNTTVVDPAKWWDTAAGDPLVDLSTMKRIVASSGYMPNFFVFGVDATTAFLGNDKVKSAYDLFNFKPGTIAPEMLQEMESFGVSAIGSFWNMPILSYEGMYEGDDAMMHYYFPPNQILVASKASQNRFCYGMVVQTEENVATGEGWGAHAVGTYQLPRVPQYVTDGTTDQLLFRLWSRPLAVPVNMKTWTVATVCTLRSLPIPVNP
jgi:hypothetical protein